MLAVRYIALAALVLWLGAMVVLGSLVAPSTIRVLEAAYPAEGRVLASLLFTDILRQFHLLALACGGVVFVSLWVMKFVGPPPGGFVPRTAIVAAMLALTLYSRVEVSPELETVRGRVSGPMLNIAETDARRVRFNELHQRSILLMTVNAGLGFVLLFWYVREGTWEL
jgi:hypothetical protein